MWSRYSKQIWCEIKSDFFTPLERSWVWVGVLTKVIYSCAFFQFIIFSILVFWDSICTLIESASGFHEIGPFVLVLDGNSIIFVHYLWNGWKGCWKWPLKSVTSHQTFLHTVTLLKATTMHLNIRNFQLLSLIILVIFIFTLCTRKEKVWKGFVVKVTNHLQSKSQP